MLGTMAKERRSSGLNRNRTRPTAPRRRRSDPNPENVDANRSTVGGGPHRVLMIASEALPFAKTGGLADVLGALPPALARLGWDVTLALPKYRGVSGGSVLEHFPVTIGGFTRDVAFEEAPLADGARAWLVDCPDLFDRDALYGVDGTDYPDNALRFAMLVRAALEYAG